MFQKRGGGSIQFPPPPAMLTGLTKITQVFISHYFLFHLLNRIYSPISFGIKTFEYINSKKLNKGAQKNLSNIMQFERVSLMPFFIIPQINPVRVYTGCRQGIMKRPVEFELSWRRVLSLPEANIQRTNFILFHKFSSRTFSIYAFIEDLRNK